MKPAIGLTFAAAMRAFVRQDPDVIMVGEVRDAETANIAIHAALTGHLVLTTLHTEIGGGGDAAPARSRRRGLPSEIDAARGHRAAARARPVRPLQGRDGSRRRRTSTPTRGSARLACKAGECVYEPAGCERCGGVGYRGRNGVSRCSK